MARAMRTYEDGALRVMHFGPLGPFDNNAYVIGDDTSKEAVIIDMPSGSAEVLTAVKQGGWRVKGILLTHSHGDHWSDYKLVKDDTQAPLMAHEAERGVLGERIDAPVADGQTLSVGPFFIRAVHTPGHTPGSTCYSVGRFVFVGDVVFPGGPGRTQTPADLQQSIRSITTRLYDFPDETEVLTGHGDGTTIGASKAEYAEFASREHPADLCGDVTWAG
jgi:glyoxylase-like metal-dependent hydrolase (beta-lactamase superfamily II)